MSVALAAIGMLFPSPSSDWNTVIETSVLQLVVSGVLCLITAGLCLPTRDRNALARLIGVRLLGVQR